MRPLRLSQKEAFYYCCSTDHPILFMEMRLGKTLVIIRWTKYLRLKKILIVAPYSAIHGWIEELQLEREDQFGMTLLSGTRDERFQKLYNTIDQNKWFFLNKEGHIVLPEVSQFNWDLVVIDESTCIKTHDTQITRFFVENFRNIPHRSILTGTPAPEGELDYYYQCKFANPAIFDEPDYWTFRNNNFGIINFEPIISPRGSKYLPARLAKHCFFMTRRDAGLGGAKIYEKRYVQMSEEIKAVYRKISKEFILEWNGDIRDATVYAPTKYNWLRRLMGGFIDGEFVFRQKLAELVYLLKTELKDQQIVVWCRFTEEIEKISDELSSLGFKVGVIYGKITPTNRTPIQISFKQKTFDILVAQPECYKHGTDCSFTSAIIYYSTPEGLETRKQSEDRIIDASNEDSCLIIDLVVQDSLEEDILESLLKKEGKQEMMRNIVKRIQREYLQAA